MASRARRMMTGLAAVAALGAAAAVGHFAGSHRADSPQTRLSLATCGLVPAPEPLDLPLAALLAKAGAPGLTLGPILHPGLDAPLSIRFRPLEAGGTPQPVQTGTLLDLPVDPDRLPDALRLSCRYGAVARVDYQRGPLRHALNVKVAADPDVAPDTGSDTGPVAGPGRPTATGRDPDPAPAIETDYVDAYPRR